MSKVSCPACDCSGYLVIAPGDIVHIFGGDSPKGCPRLQKRIEAGESIKDLLACEDMAMAVEMAIDGSIDSESHAKDNRRSQDPLASWREEPHTRRRFVRQKINLPASVSVAGTKRQCAVGDVSPRGALVNLENCEDLIPGSYVSFRPEGYRALPAEVRHINESEDTAGLMLLHEPAEQAALAQWLTSLASSSRSRVSRES